MKSPAPSTRFVPTALIALTTLALTACTPTKTSDDDVIVIKEQQLDAFLAQDRTVLIDVRIPERYAAGHIPGAINIQVPFIESQDPRLTDAKVLIVYAGGWRDPLSRAAAKRLYRLGYSNIYEFKGGIDLWERMDRSVVLGLPADASRAETNR